MAQLSPQWGVTYTPANVGLGVSHTEAGLGDTVLDHLGVRHIRLTWIDWTNTIRYHVLSRGYFRRLLRSTRPGFALGSVIFSFVCMEIVGPFGIGPKEFLLALDQSSFRVSPHDPGYATIFGFFQNLVPDPQYGLDMLQCPRTQLVRMVKLAEEKAGVTYIMGVESEFTLLKSTSPTLEVVNNAEYGTAAKLPLGSVEAKVLREIVESLEDAGIEVEKFHSEASPGQYEVITAPLPPLQAADALVIKRDTIINVAHKHGLRATFAPRIFLTAPGTGAHVHVSVHDLRPAPKTSRSDDSLAPQMSLTERSFLQGVLTNIPAVIALTLPTKFSYDRVADGLISGGTYAAWGYENRETPMRVCQTAAGTHHFEVRFVDGTACPHLALAGIIGAGTKGIIDQAVLTSGDCAKPVAMMTGEEKEKLGLKDTGRLGPTLADARKQFKESKVMRELFSDEFVDRYCVINEKLEQVFVAETEEATLTKLVNYW